MKATFKKILISFLILSSTATFAETLNIVGQYQCQRTDAANDTISYPLTIKATNGTFHLQWDDANGFPALYGTGVMSATLNHVFSVVFWNVKDPNSFGAELFSIKPDGSLQSSWAYQSTKQMGTASCMKNKP